MANSPSPRRATTSLTSSPRHRLTTSQHHNHHQQNIHLPFPPKAGLSQLDLRLSTLLGKQREQPRRRAEFIAPLNITAAVSTSDFAQLAFSGHTFQLATVWFLRCFFDLVWSGFDGHSFGNGDNTHIQAGAGNAPGSTGVSLYRCSVYGVGCLSLNSAMRPGAL